MVEDTRVTLDREPSIANLWLDGAPQRNALSRQTMAGLVKQLEDLARTPPAVIVLRGRGPVFCAGFDLTPVLQDPETLDEFIEGLSLLLRSLRRHPSVIVAGVHGAAIAGGCAIVSACDLVVVTPDASLGYPVHALGISPVVSGPTLMQAVGDGIARSLLMSGQIIDGTEAFRLGLASHLAPDAVDAAGVLARRVATYGPQALATTKAWMNELDGSNQDQRYDEPARGSRPLSRSLESMEMLRRRWRR